MTPRRDILLEFIRRNPEVPVRRIRMLYECLAGEWLSLAMLYEALREMETEGIVESRLVHGSDARGGNRQRIYLEK